MLLRFALAGYVMLMFTVQLQLGVFSLMVETMRAGAPTLELANPS